MSAPATRRRVAYHQAAALQPCPRCRRHVLAGRESGSSVIADPQNITTAGELSARLQNRETYDLIPGDYPPGLYFRWRGLTEVRSPRKFAVVADHKCGSSPLPSQPSPPYKGLLVPVRLEQPDVPPF